MKAFLASPVTAQSEGHFLIKLQTGITCADPGQFAAIRTGSNTDPLLRRPFSIFDFHDGILEIIFQVVGRGTAILSEFSGSEIDILAPLGRGFSLAENKKVLLVGGGAGNAPLHYLSRVLKQKGCNVTQVYGSRTKSVIYCRDRFCSSCDDLIFTTDDGSEGEKGFVTDAVNRLLSENKFDMVYLCGPTPMVKGLAPIIEKSGVRCEVSLENYFGCGTGLCYGCTIRTRQGNKRVCSDGPVFPFEILDAGLL
jgi:dihydroorotate dehydrogenase electron transfer subunit